MFEWKNIFRGMAMGTSDLIPGVSGGTIAVILGIYDRFIGAISGIFSREWKKHLLFLLPLGLGMVTAIFALSRVLESLLEHYPQPTNFFFLGLIFGILPYLLKESNFKETFKAKHYAIFIVGAIAVASMGFFTPEPSSSFEELTLTTYIMLYFAGWLASMAMLLPGISGSFVLLLIGLYQPILNALNTLNIPVILLVGAGIATGFIISSNVIKYLLNRFPSMMYALIIGLVLGSLFVVYPGLTLTIGNVLLSLLTFVLGLTAAIVLGRRT